MTATAGQRRRRRLAAGTSLLSLAAGCGSSQLADVADLAAEPPLPYSVLVTGGAFVEPAAAAGVAAPLQRTFPPLQPLEEVFPLQAVADVLRDGRVFVRVEPDAGAAERRASLARCADAIPMHEGELQAMLAAARRDGHDFLLVIERVRDDVIEARGVNGQWPITASVWLLIGLGMLIPDHTYESRAELHVALRDVQTGRPLYRSVLSGGAVDLSLLERTDALGVVTSILVPPFLVGDDQRVVADTVRRIASLSLLGSLARQLKSRDSESRIASALPVALSVAVDDRGLWVEVEGEDTLSAARLAVDSRAVDRGAAEFEQSLLASARESDGRWRYRGRLSPVPRGRFLQVLVQTVSGRVASTTVALRR